MILFYQKQIIFQYKYPQLTIGPICQYHNMTEFRHLLSAKVVYLLFVTKQHSETVSPILLSCKIHSGQEMHREKITPLVRYFDTKDLSSSKMKSTLSLTSNYCLISVNAERSQLPVATSQRHLPTCRAGFGLWAQPGLSQCTLIRVIFN